MKPDSYSRSDLIDRCLATAATSIICTIVIMTGIFLICVDCEDKKANEMFASWCNDWRSEAIKAGVGYFDREGGQFKFHTLTIEEQKEKFNDIIDSSTNNQITGEDRRREIVLTPEEHARLFEYILEQRSKEK